MKAVGLFLILKSKSFIHTIVIARRYDEAISKLWRKNRVFWIFEIASSSP